MWHKDKESMKLIGGGLLIAALLFGVAYGIAALLDRSVETGEIAGQDMPKFGGAPTVSYQVSLLPASSTPIHDLGTTTRKWRGVYANTASTTGITADYLCLGGTCQTSFSAGTADGTFSTTSAMYFVHGSTTIPKTYSDNTWTGTQTYSAAPVFSTITSALLATNSGGTVIATTTPTASVFNATDASATSTFAGNAYVKGNLRVDGNFYAPVQIVSSGDATINGALTVTGQTTLATSLTGYLKGASGVVSAQTTPIPIADGGTNATTIGTTNGILAYDGTRVVNFSAFTLTSALLTASNASTTNLTASQSFFINGVRQNEYRLLSGGHSTSTWVGTTTTQVLAGFTGTIKDIQCDLDAGTLNVQVYVNSTAVTPMVPASTTAGVYTFTADNTFIKGDTIKYKFGTPASSPKEADCAARTYPTQ